MRADPNERETKKSLSQVNFHGGTAKIKKVHDERAKDGGPMKDGSRSRTTGPRRRRGAFSRAVDVSEKAPGRLDRCWSDGSQCSRRRRGYGVDRPWADELSNFARIGPTNDGFRPADDPRRTAAATRRPRGRSASYGGGEGPTDDPRRTAAATKAPRTIRVARRRRRSSVRRCPFGPRTIRGVDEAR